MKTPVLLIAFNRPTQASRVLEAIRKAGATNVFVAVDGPREHHPTDVLKTSQVRDLIDGLSWPGSVTTLYREKNLGCRYGVSGAISWFFEHVDEGIILEDDCLPDPTFFGYAEELLEHYRDDERIGMISGGTFFPLGRDRDASYTFTRYPHIWGWATWKRAWDRYDGQLESWSIAGSAETLARASGGSRSFEKFWTKLLNQVHSGKIDTWDYIWSYSFWKAGFLSVTPRVNLVENIGFSADATHTRGKPLGRAFRPSSSKMSLPLSHTDLVNPDAQLEKLTRELAMGVYGKRVRSVSRLWWFIVNRFKKIG